MVSEYLARAAYQNHFEQLRDPSHSRALPISEFLTLFTSSGLEGEQLYTDDLAAAVEAWLTRAQTPAEQAGTVKDMIAQDELHDLSGTPPFRHNRGMYFHQRTVALISRKLDASQL